MQSYKYLIQSGKVNNFLIVKKKGSIKINAILYKFGHSLKVCSKTELQKLKYKKLYLPDVIEDGGVWKSKGRNRVVK